MPSRGVKISVAIQHHPRRPDLPKRLRAALHPLDSSKRSSTRIEVVSDPDPDGELNPWRTARQCWLGTPEWCSHRLVIQDDAAPCRDFLAHVKRALTAKPDRVASFYLGWMPSVTARDALVAQRWGASWVRGHASSWVPCIALAIPQPLCRSLGEYDDGTTPIADDDVVGRWCRALGLPWYATMPSLCDHDDDAPSLMRDPRATGERRAMNFIGDGDASGIDWSKD